ncbi:phage tail protein [Neptunitalea lumnitzerae]|uniref:Microcystin dependent MdpB family protein n=1 Tax=Neptunitalea lumnitzerae TaxID=2965509 RepID=A0ABQ5MMY3_9FLAO|nr:tail fiber protein [Neptunitalea sp. Y10]GLB50762.1 microcystin dependent MdpB family protein [Neptunitalea sp. Y10]
METNEYLGMVKLFAGNYAPLNWSFCNGALLEISKYQALFSVIGNFYGGDGRTTFALPDLRSRVPVGMGASPGHINYELGQLGGNETTYLTTSNLPAHTHNAHLMISNENANLRTPDASGVSSLAVNGELNGREFAPFLNYINESPNTPLNSTSVVNGSTGGNAPFDIRQPYVALNYIICIDGLYPPRS